MKGFILAAPAVFAAALLTSAETAQPASPARPPAQYKSSGSFSGGKAQGNMVISGIRFGNLEDGNAIRMVLDLDEYDQERRYPATHHPDYAVELQPYPFRLVMRLKDTYFDAKSKVQNDPALPFSIISTEGGPLKEIQVFLSGPSEFKVIEIDDPAKICIDVRPVSTVDVPDVYAVQVTDAHTPEQAFALVEQGRFPEGFSPQVLVLGTLVVVEQPFTDPALAARMDADLRAMGYASMINERGGKELPQP